MVIHYAHFFAHDSNEPKNALSTTIATRAIANIAANPLCNDPDVMFPSMKFPIPAIRVAISIAIMISHAKSYANLNPLNMCGEMAGKTIFVKVERRPDLKMVV